MSKRLAATAANLLTASGIVWAWFALMAAAESRWEEMFLWLVVALFVDAIDGPIARYVEADRVLPRFSGSRLDLIVDYVTYVLIPTFALERSDLLPSGWSIAAAIAILLSSLYHFADRESKTADYYFQGFPAVWNVVVFLLFAVHPPGSISLLAIAIFVAATFVRFRWVHPLRVVRFRAVTLGVIAMGGAAGLAAMIHGFPAPLPIQIVLLGCAAYLIGISQVNLKHRPRRGSADRD